MYTDHIWNYKEISGCRKVVRVLIDHIWNCREIGGCRKVIQVLIISDKTWPAFAEVVNFSLERGWPAGPVLCVSQNFR